MRTDTTLAASLPENFRYRVKRDLLGPPLVSDQLGGQRLGKPAALAVLSSDVMSSSAYASEQMLRILVPIAGLAAFSIVTPMTGAILAVLALVTICYRDVVRSYPKVGESYVVSRLPDASKAVTGSRSGAWWIWAAAVVLPVAVH